MRGRILFLGFIASVFLANAACADDAKIQIGIQSKLQQRSESELILQVTLENKSNLPLATYESSLPWGIRYSLTLIARKNDGTNSLLEEALYIDDPGPNRVTIPPYGNISGSINLIRRFPSLPKILHNESIHLFLSYQGRSIDGVRTNTVTEEIVIPRFMGPKASIE